MAYLAEAVISSGGDFLHRFRPCVVNYLVQFRYSTDGNYFVTPDGNYSTGPQWGTPPFGMSAAEKSKWGGIFYIGSVNDCENKLDRDFALLASSGFNTLRIAGIVPQFGNGEVTFPIEVADPSTPSVTPAFNDYLDLLTALLSKMASHGLRAILLIGANGDQWQQAGLYRQFLRTLSGALRDNPTVLAYDLYNEPAWLYPPTSEIDKLATSHWVADSYWTIKGIAPRQLVTIGLTTPDTIFDWDPALIPVDFVSYHFYGSKKADAADQVASMLWWAKETSLRPWIIGETGLAGTDTKMSSVLMCGTEADQRDYALATLQQSLNCGCDGYSWWQFQEVHWGDDFQDYLGLLTYTNLSNLSQSERQKLVFSVFSSYPGAQAKNPVKPTIYANLDGHTDAVLSGKVVDEGAKPLADASIRAKDTSGRLFSTISDSNGDFTLFAPPATTINWAQINKPGYSAADGLSTPPAVLEAWRDSAWSRRWMASEADKLKYFPEPFNSGTSLDWSIAPSDAFYVGDFDGDGADELLCVQTGGTTDAIVLLKFDGHWRLVWTNLGDPTIGGGIYPYRQQLVVGDFDGDGADEVLGTDAAGNWLTLFKYQTQTPDWVWVWSNYPSQPNHPLKPYRNHLVPGRFDGSGRDLLLGVASWTTLFRFDSVANDWQWVDSDYGTTNDASHPMSAMRPYAGELVIGDFDGDGREEVLGLGTSNSWATLFGIRGGVSFEWLTSNSGSAEAAVTGILPYRGKLTVGTFDEPGRDRILGISSRSAMFGFDGEDFQRVWSSVRNTFAGLSVLSTDRLVPFRPLKEMPGYLLIIPTFGNKASMIAFDPVTGRH